MSRYQIGERDLAREIYVGWDRPLQTFFGQVYDIARDEDDRIVHWVGASGPRIATVEDLQKAMGGYVTIDADTRQQLIHDKAAHR